MVSTPGVFEAQASSIAGRAVRSTNDEPIDRARILLIKVDGGLSDAAVLTTDDRGRFSAVVSPGTYRIVDHNIDGNPIT